MLMELFDVVAVYKMHVRVPYEAKHPILLPPKHYFTRLVILNAHQMTLHRGEGSTISFIRQSHWIPSIRQTTRNILRSCVLRAERSPANHIRNQSEQ